MAYDFTLQTKLQAPTPANVRKVNADIRRSFLGLSFNYNDKGAKKAIVDMKKIGRAADDAGKKVKNFGDKLGTQGTSYLSYALVSGAIIRLTSAFAGATNEAIKFEKELVKIAQVTRQSNGFILKNAKIITDISREYGLATTKVAELTRLLAQTGLSFKQAADGARTLAKTELLASFDNLSDTTEGLIALMNSFNLSTVDAAKGLEAINAVSKRFAVESGDIVEAIKRTGGAFSAAGGDINELIALFTSVRATSRESGETIATAFRTIFGRLQRPKTIDYFKELNIELADANGNFVGGYAAIERISRGLNELGIRAGSIKFAEIAEQVGGIRQLSKVIPLLTKFSDAQEALAVANAAEAESEDDVAKARKSLSFQIAQLTSEFRALIFEITQTAGFKIVATLFIETARAAIDLTRALKPLLPLFAAIGAFKGFKVASSVFNKLQGSKQQAQGFNRGGPVPGVGNGDTVPAMLEPGEFVIRKSAVQAYGTQNLANINKYGLGGKVSLTGEQLMSTYKGLENVKDDEKYTANVVAKKINVRTHNRVLAGMIASKRKNPKNLPWQLFEDGIAYAFNTPLNSKSNAYLDYPRKPGDAKFLKEGITYRDQDVENKAVFRKGNNNETMLAKLVGSGQYEEGKNVTVYYPDNPSQIAAVVKEKAQGKSLKFGKANIPKFAKGGSVGTDTVPSLLTPGEFVINRKSAQAFGYGKLGEINKYAKGGPVQKFSGGTTGTGVKSLAPSSGASDRTSKEQAGLTKAIQVLTESIKSGTQEWDELQNQADSLTKTIKQLDDAAFAVQKSSRNKDGEVIKTGAKGNKAILRLDTIRNQKQTELNALLDKQVKITARVDSQDVERRKAITQAKKAKEVEAVKPAAAPRPSPLDIQSAANRKRGLNKADFLSAERSKSAGPDLISGLSESSKKQRKQFQEQAKAQSNLRKETHKLQKGFALSGSSVLTFGLGMSAVGGILESFGLEMNSVSAAQKKNSILLFTTAAALISYQKQIRGLGRSLKAGKLQGFAQKLGPKFGGFVEKLGGGIQKLGSSIAKNAGKLVKGFAAIGAIDIVGSVIGSLVGGDASKARDSAIKGGNVETAGNAALKAFGQELNNQIPILGGWLNAFGVNLSFLTGGFGQLAKSSAELEATFVKNDKIFSESFKALNKSAATKDFSKFDEQIKKIANASEDERSRASGVIGQSKDRNNNLIFGNALGGATSAVESSSKSAIKGFERDADNISKAISIVSPAIDEFAASMILAGNDAETTAKAVTDKFGEPIKDLGLIKTPKQLKEQVDKIESLDKRIKNVKDRRDKESGFTFGSRRAVAISDSDIAQLEGERAKAKEAKLAADAYNASIVAAQVLLREQQAINKAYRDSALSLKRLRVELSGLNSKIADADLAAESLSSTFGGASGSKSLRKRFGTDQLSGSLQDISARGGTTLLSQLKNQASTFLGSESGNQVQQGTLLQRAADTLSQNEKTSTGKDLSTALGSLSTSIRDIDPTSSGADRKRGELTKDFLAKEIFGGNIPKELEGQIDKIVLEFSEALSSGPISAQKLSDIFKNGGAELSQQAVKAIQTQLNEQATRASRLGQAYNKLGDLRIAHAQKLFEQTRLANQAVLQIEEDRINSLVSAGADAESLRGARRSNLDKSRRSNLKSALPSVVIPSGISSDGVRGKSKFEREALAKVTQAIASRPANGGIAQTGNAVDATLKAEAAQNTERNKAVQSLQNLNTVLAKDNELRKKGLEIEIQEAVARRNNIQALNDAVGNIVTEFAFGSDKQRTDIAESAAVTRGALSQGGLQGLTGDQRGAVGSFLDRFSGAGKLDIFGGKDAATVKGEFAAKEAVQAGLIKPSEFQKFADAAAKKAVPVEDRIQEKINATYSEIEKNQNAINANEKVIVETQGAAIKTFEASVAEFATATRAFFERSGNNQQRAVQMDRAEEVRNEQARRMRLLPSQLSNTGGDQQGGSQDANVQLSPVKVDVGGPWVKAIEGLAKDVVTKGVLQAVGLKLLEVAQNTDGSTTPQDLARTNAEMFQNGVELVQ